jgi:hypothetical protein
VTILRLCPILTCSSWVDRADSTKPAISNLLFSFTPESSNASYAAKLKEETSGGHATIREDNLPSRGKSTDMTHVTVTFSGTHEFL